MTKAKTVTECNRIVVVLEKVIIAFCDFLSKQKKIKKKL
jgi:hypothetical protein